MEGCKHYLYVYPLKRRLINFTFHVNILKGRLVNFTCHLYTLKGSYVSTTCHLYTLKGRHVNLTSIHRLWKSLLAIYKPWKAGMYTLLLFIDYENHYLPCIYLERQACKHHLELILRTGIGRYYKTKNGSYKYVCMFEYVCVFMFVYK